MHRTTLQRKRARRFLIALLILCIYGFRAEAGTYTVTNANDAGAGSLRDAITQSNAAGAGNTINFNIPGISPHTITLVTALPAIIQNNTIIDGTTQPANGFSGVSPKIILIGPGSGIGIAVGNITYGSGSKIYGLYITNFNEGIYINVDNVVIGDAGKRNVISGNVSHGIEINANSGSGTVIKGNYIGLDSLGTAIKANGGDGIRNSGNSVSNMVIGGSAAGERNIISGNTGNGIYINANSSSGHIIKGNYIGTDVTGTVKKPNGQHGINSGGNSTGGTLGGNLAGEGNVISGNGQNGLYFSSSNSAGWVLKGNFIGTNAAGTGALGNTLNGIDGLSGSNSMTVTVGGANSGDGNVISGNGASGIRFRVCTSFHYSVYGNKIGTDLTGTVKLGNTDYGVYLDNVSSVPIGGTSSAGQKNIIAFNGKEGVYVHGSNSIINGIQNEIHRNSFFCNSQTSGIGGILLDNGGNYMIPAPVIVNAGATGCSGTAPANALVEIFYDDSCTFCEGKTYIGSVTANGSGSWTYTGALASGRLVATATLAADGTSEFSTCIPVCNLAVNSVSSASASCYGTSTGSATVTAGSGFPAYTYLWSPGGQTTSTATGLSSGTYTVLVTDAGGCTQTSTVSVTQPSAALSATLTSSSNVSCNGGTNGSASIFTTGGTPNYTFLWTPGGQTSPTATGLSKGTYTVIVTDSAGCSQSLSVPISQPPVLTAIVRSNSNINCYGGFTGSANVLAGGGTPGYTYLWAPGGQTANNATGLAAGMYTVTVTDSLGCVKSDSVYLSQPVSPLSNTVSSTPAGCTVSNGSAAAIPSGGTPLYTYLWSPGGQTSPTATGLAGGSYTVLVTDSHGCTHSDTVKVGITGTPTETVTSTLAGCSVANGTASVNPSGGTPGYTFLWSPGGQNSSTATGLTGGTYTIIVTDNNGCSVRDTVHVAMTTAPTAAASATRATCGQANGTGIVNPAGGTPGYTYNWAGGQITQTATGFTPGTYTVLVTDANGCTAASSITVTAANGPTVSVAATATVLCNGGANGVATATVTGGTSPLTYSWSNGQTASIATGLTAGTYTVMVRDSNNCSFNTTVLISEPAPLVSPVSHVNVKCHGGNSGSAAVTPAGGTPNYTYSWSTSPAQTGPSATGLTTGQYTVTTTDANGCSVTDTVMITQPAALGAVPSQTNVKCFGGTGSASVTATGGTLNYTYSWSTVPIQSTSSATGLSAGNYTVITTDANGCADTSALVITQPAALTYTVSHVNVKCNGGNTGSATITLSGGTPGYTYAWAPSGQTGSTATGLSSGTYTATTTDANGCKVSDTVSVKQPPVLSLSASHVNVKCNGGNTGSATATATGGTPNYTYSWTTSPLQTVSSATGLSAGTYTVVTTDANGCKATDTVSIQQPPKLTLSVRGNNTICLGMSTTLDALPLGGTPAYTYAWNPAMQSGSSVVVNPTSSTGYSVTIGDANGCSSVPQVYSVTVNPVPKAGFDTASSGMFSHVYLFKDLSSGGSGWVWDFGDGSGSSTQQNPTHNFPGAGTYTVTQIVYNQFGCPDTFRIEIKVGVDILIPNVFTPDHNGVNDVWYIPNSGMQEFHVVIFDRWGAKVWEATADEIRWDGRTASGMLLSDGTYYYVLHAILRTGAGSGKDYSRTGYVTLLTSPGQQ